MRQIFADHCVHGLTIRTLREHGFEIIRALEWGLERAPDTDIFETACTRKLLLLTFDRGFGNFRKFNIRESSGVVVVLAEDRPRQEVADDALHFFLARDRENLQGTLYIVDRGRVRVRNKFTV